MIRRVPALPDDGLLTALRSLGSVPSGLSPSIAARFFPPGFRADVRMALGYVPGGAATAHGRRCWCWRADRIRWWTGCRRQGWGRNTDGGCTVIRHDGGHFALYDRVPWSTGLIGAARRRCPGAAQLSFDRGERHRCQGAICSSGCPRPASGSCP
jgi:surfactin synthase thioesterase subunit